LSGPGTDPTETSQIQRTSYRIEQWSPSLGISVLWTILGTMMTIAGFLSFAFLYSVLGDGLSSASWGVDYRFEDGTTEVTFQLGGLLPIILAMFGILIVHEAVHAAGFRWFGGRPTVGAMVIQKVLPVFYCSAPGSRFTRNQFSIIILAPVVVISVAGTVLMPFVNNGMLLVLPLAVNFGGAIGDVWMFGMILRRRSDTLIEDLKDGLRFHYPEDGDQAAALASNVHQG
jgi:hypothetical protein